jgi:hypothetical protein
VAATLLCGSAGGAWAQAMQTDAANATNPTALENLTGGLITYSGSQIQILGTTDTGWQSLFPSAKLVVTQHGQNNAPILGYFYNDLANATEATPAAITGYGNLDQDKTGNHVFGLYGRARNASATGVATAAEVTCRNDTNTDADTNLPPDMSIGTETVVCNGLNVTVGGTYNKNGSLGIYVASEGGSSSMFATGIYIRKYSTHGLYIDPPPATASDTLNAGNLFSVGTGTTTSTVSLGGTNASSSTGTLIGLNASQSFNPAGASLSGVRGQSNAPTISGSALTIGNVFAYYGGINTGAGFTGTIAAAHEFFSPDPSLSGPNPITNFYGFHQASVSNGSGNTSGTITNNGLKIDAFTATAGSGGTMNNNGVAIALPSGTNAGTTTNTGLSITGNGQGGGATNWAINSTSTAPSQFAGPVNLAAGGTLTDTTNQEFEVSSATLTKVNNTTLAVVPGLSQALTGGKTYHCRGHLTGTAGASGGIKVALVATGGLTATQATFTGFAWNGTTAVANTTATALGSNIAANTAVYSDVWIDGSIVVNAAGTINVEAAQNASNGTATTVLQGSTFSCVRTN